MEANLVESNDEAVNPSDEISSELGSYTLQLMWHLKQRAARAFEPLGFRTNRAVVLEFIALGYSQPKDLHRALGIVPPAISTIVAELEDRGLLERQIDSQDGRRVNLYLTPKGHAVRRQLQVAWHEARRDYYESLSKNDIADSLELYRKVFDKPLK